MFRVVLPALFVTLAAAAASAQTALQLRWELKEDVFQGPNDEGASRVVLTLTNRDTKALAPRGWAIYWTALHVPRAGSARGGVAIEEVTGNLQRIVPGAGFSGLAPGAERRARVSDRPPHQHQLRPHGAVPRLRRSPAKGHALKDYLAVPFERPSQSGATPAS